MRIGNIVILAGFGMVAVAITVSELTVRMPLAGSMVPVITGAVIAIMAGMMINRHTGENYS